MADQVFNVECGFFDAVNDDRLYAADDMCRPYDRLLSSGIFPLPSGAPGSDFEVVSAGSGMKIVVKGGQGMFARKWFQNPAAFQITVPNNTAANPRVDSVVIQVDLRTSGRVGNIVYRTGTASATPAAPAINQVTKVQEWRLANVYVAPSASSISNSMITDMRGKSNGTPWITSLLSGYMNIKSHRSNYIATAAVTNVPINIEDYNWQEDVLQVFINGIFAVEGEKYNINQNGTSIDLTTQLLAGQEVNFIVLQSVKGAGDNVTRYMGAVATYADLPTSGMVLGDVWMIQQSDPTHGIVAGDNVMWNGYDWEILQTVITTQQINAIIASIS